MAVRDGGPAAFAFRGTDPQARHFGRCSGFLDEDQALRIDETLFEGRDPLYSSGFNWVTTMAAVPLGTARRALAEAKALIAGGRAASRRSR